jgi:hypothetical protein
MQTQPANLNEKTNRYMLMLQGALGNVIIAPPERSYLHTIAKDYLNMARSYYNDGVYFMKNDDSVNALACFSYGHAWLDAGARLGVFAVEDETLFAL